MSASRPPLGPITEVVWGREYLDAICPECGDQAFFVELDDPPSSFAFSCDSCEYFIEAGEHPRVAELARELGMRP